MDQKKVSIAVLMFILMVALIHPRMTVVLAQELARSSAGGITSQSVTPINQPQHARLAAFGASFGDGTKFDAPAVAPVSQVNLKPPDGTAASANNDPGENDKCDCAERFFPKSEMTVPASQ